jgi:hypothetical protein
VPGFRPWRIEILTAALGLVGSFNYLKIWHMAAGYNRHKWSFWAGIAGIGDILQMGAEAG